MEQDTHHHIDPDMLARIQQLNNKFDLKMREKREAWVNAHKERTPVYPTTQEEGTFAGLFSRLTGAGVVIYPYYQTGSGISFYEWEDPKAKRKTTISIDLEIMKKIRYC